MVVVVGLGGDGSGFGRGFEGSGGDEEEKVVVVEGMEREEIVVVVVVMVGFDGEEGKRI